MFYWSNENKNLNKWNDMMSVYEKNFLDLFVKVKDLVWISIRLIEIMIKC